MDRPASKRRRYERSITPEKSKAKRKATLFVVENNSVSKNYRDRSESPEPKQKKKNLESNYKSKKSQKPEKTKNSQKRRRKITPEREAEQEPISREIEQIKVSLPITLMNYCDTTLTMMQGVNTLLQTTKKTFEEKLTDIDKRLSEMNQRHNKHWEDVSEMLAVISKHIISESKTESKENDDHESERNFESPTTTFQDDILQKAEQFSEQNKAKIAEEKAQLETNERTRTLEANSQMVLNQPTTRISLNLTSQGQQVLQNYQKIIEKQQISQVESQMTWHDQQEKESEQLMRQIEVRQQMASFYQKQQNARMEQHVAAQVEQQIQLQREEITRSQELQQQQQQIIDHEHVISSHNEQLAKHKAQLANEPISIMERMIVPDYANSTPATAKEMPEQRVLRPRPTTQVVLQDPFVQPKQRAPRKLATAAKQIRGRRASVQCDGPPLPYYPHLPMRVPAPVPQATFTQTNARLVEENFQQQLQQTQALAALQNQEMQQQQTKAAKVRERRKSCMPSMSYLDQGMCHEMLRRRLTNAQAQNMHDQTNFYPQPMRYFASSTQSGSSSEYAHYAAQSSGKAGTTVGIDLSVNNVEKTGQKLSHDPVDWMRGRSTSITRITNTSR